MPALISSSRTTLKSLSVPLYPTLITILLSHPPTQLRRLEILGSSTDKRGLDLILPRLINLKALIISAHHVNKPSHLLLLPKLQHLTLRRFDSQYLLDLSAVLDGLHLITIKFEASNLARILTKHPIIKLAKEANVKLTWG